MPQGDPQADLTERARAIRRKIRQKFESEDPTWRSAVSRYSLTEKKADEFLATALQSEREAAAAETRRADIAVLEKYHADILENEDWPGQATDMLGVLDCAINMLSALTSPPAPQEDTR